MKVLISGGSGFIGSHLVASLVNDGHDVVVLSRRPEPMNTARGVRYVTWDARRAGAGARADTRPAAAAGAGECVGHRLLRGPRRRGHHRGEPGRRFVPRPPQPAMGNRRATR